MKRRAKLPLAAALAAILLLPAAASGHAGHGLEGVKVDPKGAIALKSIGRFSHPTFVTGHPTAPAVLVVEKFGKVRVVRKGKKRKRPFLNIKGEVSATLLNERGLLSIAFAPDYATSGLVYAFYTNRAGNLVVAEFGRGGGDLDADEGSQRVLLDIPHPGASNHNGGQIQFGPDGLLYVATGDGGGAGDPDDSAQNPDSLLGKILRIDPRPSATRPYTIPPDNPFAAGGGRPEVYALGLRNPYRFSFDAVSGPEPRIVIADVGQFRFEEIDYETVAGARGANFGWNDFEGFERFSGANAPAPASDEKPIYAYRTRRKSCSVIGGFVGRGAAPGPVSGRYLFGDFCNGRLRTLVPDLGGARKIRRLGVTVPALTSFGEAGNGTLYAASLDGPVYRLKRKR
ncbi:MAG: PQQ-dependent sugar dehydrogenase [Solirubrobacterales bacterium]